MGTTYILRLLSKLHGRSQWFEIPEGYIFESGSLNPAQ